MNIWKAGLLLLAIMPAYATPAQTSDSVQNLKQALAKRQLFLRDFSAENKIVWQWHDGAVVHPQPEVHILSALKITNVSVKSAVVEIAGSRDALVRKNDKELAFVDLGEPVMIKIDLTGADLSSVLPTLPNLLFFTDARDALANLPEEYKKILPAKIDGSRASLTQKPEDSPCDCATPDTQQCKNRSAGLTPPKLIHSAEPEFTEQTRGHTFNTDVQIGLDVDTNGLPADLWIVKPAAFNLDASAIKAVLQYRFAPATCHGTPRKIRVYIDVTFQSG